MMVANRWWLVLPLFIGAGGVVGYLARDAVVRQQAVLTVPRPLELAEIAEFNGAERMLASVEEFRRFGAHRNLLQNPEFQQIEKRLASGAGMPMIQYRMRISKRDIRDLPDGILKDVQVGNGNAAQSKDDLADLVVTATSRSAAVAAAMAEMTMQYCRETLLRTSLKRALENWNKSAKEDTAGTLERISLLRAQLDSLTRRIALMESVREKYKDARDAFQVQAKDVSGLSPLQQLVVLEVERVGVMENLRLAEDDLRRYGALGDVANKYLAKMWTQYTPQDLLQEILGEVQRLKEQSDAKQSPAVAQAYESMNVYLTNARVRFVEASANEERPSISVVSNTFGRILFVLGLMGGAVLGFLFLNRQWLSDRLIKRET